MRAASSFVFLLSGSREFSVWLSARGGRSRAQKKRGGRRFWPRACVMPVNHAPCYLATSAFMRKFDRPAARHVKTIRLIVVAAAYAFECVRHLSQKYESRALPDEPLSGPICLRFSLSDVFACLTENLHALMQCAVSAALFFTCATQGCSL